MMTPARIYDISTSGAAIDLMGPFSGVVGSAVRVESTEISFLEGKVRWYNKGRLGVEFEPSTNAVAKVKAYFKYFHKEPIVQT
ncbi:MAG: PilZ protein [Rhizobium sp.]|nr:PilZ protein [Rhizobium sp.]